MNKIKLASAFTVLSTCTMLLTGTPAMAESTSVDINIEPTQLTFSVPEVITVSMNADGTTTTPTNYGITDNTPNVAIEVKSFEVVGNTVGDKKWSLTDNEADIKSVVDNTKVKLSMAFGSDEMTSLTNGYTVTDGIINEGDTKTATFEMVRSAQTVESTVKGAFVITPTVDFAR